MVKKVLCIVGWITHVLLAELLFGWAALPSGIPYTKLYLLLDFLFLVFCVVIGIVFLKLDIDKLFLKLESGRVCRRDKIILLIGGISALLVVGFEMVTVFIFFIKGIKMEPVEFIRFNVIPTLSLLHIAVGTGSYLASQYFKDYVN